MHTGFKGAINLNLTGSGGQSFGVFLAGKSQLPYSTYVVTAPTLCNGNAQPGGECVCVLSCVCDQHSLIQALEVDLP